MQLQRMQLMFSYAKYGKLDGIPSKIISDMDAKFSGEFWESCCKSLNIKRRMSTAYYPQTDRQTEWTNQVLEVYLRNFVNYDQNDWYQLLPLAEHAYNNSVTNAHRMSPFYANYCFSPRNRVDERTRSSKSWSTTLSTLDANITLESP